MISSGQKAGVGIRSVVNKAVGFSSVSSIEEKKALEAAEGATKIAKIRPPDPNWSSLPDAKTPTGEGGIYDKRILELEIEALLESCSGCCVAIGDFDKRIIQAMAMITATSASFATINTNGVEALDRRTDLTGFFTAKAKSGAEEVSSGEELISREYSEDFYSLATNASRRTIECLGKKPLPEKYVGEVLFENVSWNELFSVIFPSGISALNVQENRSVYKGKIGSQVAKEALSIADEGTLPKGFGTTKIDDEGVPRQKTPIIEKGVLSRVLYDNYTAKRESRESTGNASRQWGSGSAYANQPMIRPSNLLISPGAGGFNDVLRQIGNGILVKGSLTGASHSNVITGDFSVNASNAFKVENGHVAYPLRPCTIAGNLYEALNSVTAIGNDTRSFRIVLCPSLIIDKIVVST
jgi:PmbA protein